LVEKKVRKIHLFNTLFRKQRVGEGYQLRTFDDLRSYSVVDDTPTILSEGYLETQPFVL